MVGKVKEVDGETYAIIKDYGLTTKELREIAKMIDNKIKKEVNNNGRTSKHTKRNKLA